MSINRKAGFLLSVLLFPFQIIASQTVNTGSNSLPDPKQVTGDPYAKEAYVFELIENRVQFEADGKGEPDFKMRVRIQSESAVREFGLLVYPYASSFESLEVPYVRVHKPDGTSVETPPSDIRNSIRRSAEKHPRTPTNARNTSPSNRWHRAISLRPIFVGRSPLGTGKPEELIPPLETALAGDPDNNDILLSLSRAYSDAGRPSDAVAVLQKAISNHPDIPRHLLLALGFAYLRVPDVSESHDPIQEGPRR